MPLRRAPFALPALLLIVGAAAASHLPHVRIPTVVLLIALGAAIGGRLGAVVVPLGCGLALGWLGRPEPLRVDPDRPAILLGRLIGLPEQTDDGWRATVKVDLVRQGSRSTPWNGVVHLALRSSSFPAGSRFRIRGHLRRGAGTANPAPRDIGPWRMTLRHPSLASRLPGGWRERLVQTSRRLRRRIRSALIADGYLSPGERLVRTMILGEAGALPDSQRAALRHLGLAHLTALSGLHVFLLAGFAWLATAWAPRSVRVAAALATIGLFLAVAGPRPGLLRASGMAVAVLAQQLAARPPQSVNALAWMAVLLVVLDPQCLRRLAFQLTMAGTAGLLIVGPALRASTGLPTALAAAAGAQLATLPFALPRFGLLVPLGPVWNVLALPWVSLVLIGSAAHAVWIAFVGDSARWLAAIMEVLATPLVATAELRTSAQSIRLAVSSVEAWILTVTVFGVLTLRGKRRLWAVAVVASACSAAAFLEFDRSVEVALFDVGQGDAVLLRDPDHAVLVDGGGWWRGDVAGSVVAPSLAALGIRHLDLAVLTHPDLDHCEGLVQLSPHVSIDELWVGPGTADSECARRLVAGVSGRPRAVWVGTTREVGEWHLSVVHPAAGSEGSRNDGSLVILAKARQRRVLLAGDLEASGEAALLRRYGPDDLRADILKVPHHGSRTSTSKALLQAVQPRLALISVGRNNVYHHPSQIVVDRLSDHGVKSLRTDLSGWIRVRLTRRSLQIETPAAPP